MIVLCIESSAQPTVIGVVRGEQVLAEKVFPERDHLIPAISDMLRVLQLKPKDFSAIAFGIGPGSFTGLRISLAFAKGFARACGCSLLPVSSLKIIAANGKEQAKTLTVILPARRGEVHCAVYHGDNLQELTPPKTVSCESLSQHLQPSTQLMGEGIHKLPEAVYGQFLNLIPEDPELHRPHSNQIARMARAEWGEKTPPEIRTLVPVYGLDFPVK